MDDDWYCCCCNLFGVIVELDYDNNASRVITAALFDFVCFILSTSKSTTRNGG